MLIFLPASWFVIELFCLYAYFWRYSVVVLGVIGEYVGKIYLESKRRPRYVIGDRVG